MVSAATDTPRSMPIPEPGSTPRRQGDTNVGQIERVISVMLGSLLVANGLKRMSLLGLGIAGAGAALVQRGASGQCSMYKALNVTTARDAELGQETTTKLLSNPFHQHIRVEKAVTVNKPVEEVYKYWRKLENLPTFMKHLDSVQESGNRSHWIAKGPRGRSVEWDAEIVSEEENQKIAWKSIQGSDVSNAGQVLFEKIGDATRVHVVLMYDPPAGVAGVLFAKLFGEEPSQSVMEDLRRFKQMMETGDVPAKSD